MNLLQQKPTAYMMLQANTIRGIVDLQAQYSGRMTHIDGLVTEQDMTAPLISWHDLSQLDICSLPEGTALCNFCTAEAGLVNNALVTTSDNASR